MADLTDSNRGSSTSRLPDAGDLGQPPVDHGAAGAGEPQANRGDDEAGEHECEQRQQERHGYTSMVTIFRIQR